MKVVRHPYQVPKPISEVNPGKVFTLPEGHDVYLKLVEDTEGTNAANMKGGLTYRMTNDTLVVEIEGCFVQDYEKITQDNHMKFKELEEALRKAQRDFDEFQSNLRN